MNKKWFAAIAAILLGAIVAAAFWLARGDNSVDITQLDERDLREYADEVVGVDLIIGEYRRDSLAKFRTDEDKQRHDEAEKQWFDEQATEDERNRWAYQLALQLQIIQASQVLYETLPEEFGDDGVLYSAYFEAMSLCAAESGFSDLVLVNPPPAEDERLKEEHGISFGYGYYDQLMPNYGITLDEYFLLRHECAKWAESYPTLDVTERDRLLALRDDHYWQEIKDFMLKNPDLVIPRLDSSDCTAEFIAECVGK